jgi:hypothetical protein
MDIIIEIHSEVEFANGQSSRDLRASSENLYERTDSSDQLEALRTDSDEVLARQIELPDGLGESPALRVQVHGTVAEPNESYCWCC